MKIEKLNDNQIRCTLTRADLASRELKLSELICGSEKAKALFQDMMKQAASEFGFEAEDMPLMIEAIPSSSDSIVLIITKVDDSEDLDSKFSKLEGADRLLDLFHKIKKTMQEKDMDLPFGEPLLEESRSSKSKSGLESEETSSKDPKTAKIRLFSFSTLDNVIRACKLLKPMYRGANTLYKDTDNNTDKHSGECQNSYILAITQSEHTADEFYRICNMMSEFGSAEKVTPAVLAFLEEHCEVIISVEAVQRLGSL